MLKLPLRPVAVMDRAALYSVVIGGLGLAAAVYYLRLVRNCTIVRRAAFDIGSGYTKLQVADVRAADGAIAKILLETEVKLAYKVDAQQSADGSLSVDIRAKGLRLFTELTAQAVQLGATEATGIATEIFRKAPNGGEFLAALTRATGVRITRISQDAEARLGLATAEALNGGPSADYAAAWDSGGASFQITGRAGPPSAPIASVPVRAFTATLGTGPAFERLLVQVQGKAYDVAASPCPVSRAEAARLVAALQAELEPPVAWLRGATILAIGGWNSLWPVALRALGKSPSPRAKARPARPARPAARALRASPAPPLSQACRHRHSRGGMRVCPAVLQAREEVFPEAGSLTVAEARRALEIVCDKAADDPLLLDIAGHNPGAETPSFVVPKVALLVAVASHLGLEKIVFRPATGGCAGLMALGEFVAIDARAVTVNRDP